MTIDISTDLMINANGNILTTPTNNGLYDTGGVPGQYEPGLDFSATDKVSKGTTATYQINISLNSKSNQTYPLDRLTIGSADRAGNLNYVNVYHLNNDPDALDTIDTGINTILTDVVATLVPVVLQSGISSDSTLTTSLVFDLPSSTYWKTKIEPSILIIAEKDGIQATYQFTLPHVLLAPKAYFASQIYVAPTINEDVTFAGGQFAMPFFITSSTSTIPNITLLANTPDFDSVTYSVDLTANLNASLDLPLLANGFTFTPPLGFTVTSYSYLGDTLSFTLAGPYKSVLSQSYTTKIVATIAYTPSPGETNASLAFFGNWSAGPEPVSVVGNNNYQILYDVSSFGNIIATAQFVDLTDGGLGALRIRQVIANSGLYYNGISQYVAATHNDLFYVAIGSQYVLLVDSKVASLEPATNPLVSLSYTDFSGNLQTVPVLSSFYTQSFAYADTTVVGYDPNDTIMAVLLGTIPSGSYASIVAGGHNPNIRVLTLTQNPWAGTTYNPMITHQIMFNDVQFDPLTATEFMARCQADPTGDYTTYLHSYISLNTTIPTVAEAYALYGQLMASMDNFQLRNGSVFLNLGTTTKGSYMTTIEFNDFSVVQNAVLMPQWFSEFENGIVNASGVAIDPIADYTQSYFCIFRRKAQPIGVEIDTTDHASFKYDSTGSGFQAHSNIVRIQNMPLSVTPPPVKVVAPAQIDGWLNPSAQFTISFTLPNSVNTDPVTTLIFQDLIDPRLMVMSSAISLSASVYYTVTNLSVGSQVAYQVITNIPAGQTGDLPATVILTIDVQRLHPSVCAMQIENFATMQVNNQSPILSNIVTLQVVNPQSIIDLGESIALEQTALAHILNAEGEKLQKIIAHTTATPELLLEANQSVVGMIKSITRLEMVLSAKLRYFSCD